MSLLLDRLTRYSIGESKDSDGKDPEVVKRFTQAWISTTVFMWIYTFATFVLLEELSAWIIGLVCTLIHSFTPVIYRRTKTLLLPGICITLTGLIFQTTFAIFNGGVESTAVIWFAVHPVILSFFANRALVVASVLINLSIIIALTILGNSDLLPLDQVTPRMNIYLLVSVLIGLSVVVATYTLFFISKSESSQRLLNERNKFIENLMMIITHDISNAMTVSMMSARSLQKYFIENEVAQKKIDMIHRSNKQIKEVSTSLRQWMKASHNEIPLKKEELTIAEIKEHISNTFTQELLNKNIKIKYVTDLPDDYTLVVDASAFKYHILNNIISNSVKFSLHDSLITIEISDIGNNAHFKVVDEGIGIPEERIANLFDPFKGQSRDGTDNEKGTGFGLSIVKMIIESMNGELEITSPNNCVGTEVNILIPQLKNIARK